jgi:hypothetical protein
MGGRRVVMRCVGTAIALTFFGALVSELAGVTGCSKLPPKKPAAPPPSCFHTSSHKEWIDPASCRNFDDVGPAFVPEPDKSAK